MKTALIIPAYKPTEDMPVLLEQFRGDERFVPVVVDDGSGPECEAIFANVPDFAVFLRHDVNRGKGAALKTAMRYILENMPECDFALTADADGQHRYADIVRVNETLIRNPDALVLGSRAFTGDVPFRSRFGNGVTRQVFSIASGAKVYDTQTGLRAFGRDCMRSFIEIPGDRYEYEINMLLQAAQSGTEIIEERIETVYLNDNSSSHFNPFKDSLKIYMCILKFSCSSLIAFVIDYVLFLLLRALTGGMADNIGLLISEIGARIVSASVNFSINRKIVFKGNETLGKAIAKYALLAAVILAVNYAMMYVLTIILHMNNALAKIIVECLLFFGSFAAQGLSLIHI